MVKEGKIKLSNTEIDYISFGRGKRPLIMIQGLNTRGIKGAGASLSLMYHLFSKEYKVYFFDRRPDLWEGITSRDLAADIAEAMDVLEIKGADVLGVSQGGIIAQYLAIDRPDLVNKMVLAFTLSQNNDTLISTIKGWISMTEAKDYKSLVRDMAEKMYSDKYLKMYRPFLPLLTMLQKPENDERFITLAMACLNCNTYSELDKIHCPVLVIGAENDKIVTLDASREIAERLGCELFIYEGLGHAAYEEAKDFNRRVYSFLISGAKNELHN